MIHRALNSIPAKPVLYIAPLIIVLVMMFYYSSLKNQCTDLTSQRQSLLEHATAAASSGSTLKLSDVTDFPWQRVKGFANFKPEYDVIGSCPFGWGWSSDQRQHLIAEGLLSVLIFFNEDAVSKYIEFRGDEIWIDDFDRALTPDSAVFAAQQTGADGSTIRLSVIP